MERIDPRERYSQHAKSAATPPEVLREALRAFGVSPEAFALRKLSGGFMNANYVAEGGGRRLLVRVYSTSMHYARKEHDLLRLLGAHPVRVPESFAAMDLLGVPVVLMEFLDGVTLEERLRLDPPTGLGIYRDVGRELGEIHRVTFSDAGFLGPGAKPGKEYENFSAFLGEFIRRTLKQLEAQPERLAPEVNARFRRLLEGAWYIPLATEPTRQLVHADFNPKNILVTRDPDPKVLGVIDWEFADSGNGLIDIGNFFRFEYDYPSGARAAFVEGYRGVQPALPARWEEAARLLDLANMCSFLERSEDYQKSFRTARAVILGTLEHFGY